MTAAGEALPERVGVLGGGRMGAGIAQVLLAAGCRVVLLEQSPDAVRAARDRVAAGLARIPDPPPLDGLCATTAAAELACCGLVVEAVPEDAELKRQVLELAAEAAPAAVLATNTSSLSVSALAATLAVPERFLGLHFFNPVPVSSLVEVVVGRRTAPDLVDRAKGWVQALGRTAVVVTDSPGFASSRLGVALALEAIRMLEEQVASAEDIDTAMTLGYRHATGPLRTTDLVGLDVRLAIAEHLARELGPRFEPPQLLRDLVAAGHLGRKAGRGFYRW